MILKISILDKDQKNIAGTGTMYNWSVTTAVQPQATEVTVVVQKLDSSAFFDFLR